MAEGRIHDLPMAGMDSSYHNMDYDFLEGEILMDMEMWLILWVSMLCISALIILMYDPEEVPKIVLIATPILCMVSIIGSITSATILIAERASLCG